jgi:hypothetical protein
MQFIRIGQYLAASMITGPKHNLLQIRLSELPQGVPVCEKLPPAGTCVHKPLDEKTIISFILEGLAEANARCGSRHAVTHIRYVENDTGPEVVYGHMCKKIVEHLQAGGVFSESTSPSRGGANAI